ncbi:MAG: deoxyribose-phosphate aldolase [Bacteroidales bacterium]|nr:deoxyribose-phosphate aldolase [Bacteroidales bacterium]
MSDNQKTITIQKFPFSEAQFKQRVKNDTTFTYTKDEELAMCRTILGSIDLTTLEGSDTEEKVRKLCDTAISFRDDEKQIPSTASVCVYPPFVAVAKDQLKGTGIHVASVAGAFPSGQLPIQLKVAEVTYAVAQGADEIDMVISRGAFLSGKFQQVYDEIRAIRNACPKQKLKVILETGELETPQNIYRASQLAIHAGADYLKTSTGKIAVNATPEAFWVMMLAIQQHYQNTGEKVGIKVAGGVSTPEQAYTYLHIWRQNMGKDWVTPDLFRVGTSRLATKIFEKIQENFL